MKSIIQKDWNECYLCGRRDALEKHHVFGGANRTNSETYGLTVRLCHWCHNEPPNGVHHNTYLMQDMRAEAQRIFEKTHSEEDFYRIFGRRNYK